MPNLNQNLLNIHFPGFTRFKSFVQRIVAGYKPNTNIFLDLYHNMNQFGWKHRLWIENWVNPKLVTFQSEQVPLWGQIAAAKLSKSCSFRTRGMLFNFCININSMSSLAQNVNSWSYIIYFRHLDCSSKGMLFIEKRNVGHWKWVAEKKGEKS